MCSPPMLSPHAVALTFPKPKRVGSPVKEEVEPSSATIHTGQVNVFLQRGSSQKKNWLERVLERRKVRLVLSSHVFSAFTKDSSRLWSVPLTNVLRVTLQPDPLEKSGRFVVHTIEPISVVDRSVRKRSSTRAARERERVRMPLSAQASDKVVSPKNTQGGDAIVMQAGSRDDAKLWVERLDKALADSVDSAEKEKLQNAISLLQAEGYKLMDKVRMQSNTVLWSMRSAVAGVVVDIFKTCDESTEASCGHCSDEAKANTTPVKPTRTASGAETPGSDSNVESPTPSTSKKSSPIVRQLRSVRRMSLNRMFDPSILDLSTSRMVSPSAAAAVAASAAVVRSRTSAQETKIAHRVVNAEEYGGASLHGTSSVDGTPKARSPKKKSCLDQSTHEQLEGRNNTAATHFGFSSSDSDAEDTDTDTDSGDDNSVESVNVLDLRIDGIGVTDDVQVNKVKKLRSRPKRDTHGDAHSHSSPCLSPANGLARSPQKVRCSYVGRSAVVSSW